MKFKSNAHRRAVMQYIKNNEKKFDSKYANMSESEKQKFEDIN